jgi:hypothetical protein
MHRAGEMFVAHSAEQVSAWRRNGLLISMRGISQNGLRITHEVLRSQGLALDAALRDTR